MSSLEPVLTWFVFSSFLGFFSHVCFVRKGKNILGGENKTPDLVNLFHAKIRDETSGFVLLLFF